MRPRKYKYRIAVWRYLKEGDNFGGNEVSEEKVSDSWCNIRSLPTNKLTEYGLDENEKAIVVTLRHRNDLDYNESNLFFIYKEVRYAINQVTETNLEGYEFKIIASAK